MEKKFCKICGNEFETEIGEAEVCPQCENENADLTIDEIDNTASELENQDLAEENTALEETENSDFDNNEAVFENDEESSEEIIADELGEEEAASYEEAARSKEQKKKKLIKIISITAGAVVVIAAVLFVPFKKDAAFNRTATTVVETKKPEVITKRTNLFNSVRSAITFLANSDTAMVIDGEKIDKAIFEYYYNVAQGRLVSEKGDDIINDKEFWNSEETKAKLRNDAKADLISLVAAMHKAQEKGITLTDDEKSQADSYVESMGEDFLKELNLSKEQVKFIINSNSLASKLSQSVVTEDEKFNITDEQIENYVKTQTDKITAKVILFSTYELKADEKTAVEAKAAETLDKINAGEDFDTLMNSVSEDPALKMYPDGYTFGKGQMIKEFEDAAFALKENEVSGLIQSDSGIFIIKRVPLTLSQTDISSQKLELQSNMFVDETMRWGTKLTILANDAYINTLNPTVQDNAQE